jgi:hypothetical protein
MRSLAGTVAAILLSASAVSAQSFIDEIQRGARDGRVAGREASLLVPVLAGAGTGAALALTDNAELTNNHIVSAVVLNSAATVVATWVSSLVLPPRPSREDRQMLSLQTPEYARQWENGFRESAGNRRFMGKLLGSFSGVALGIAIYAIRAR